METAIKCLLSAVRTITKRAAASAAAQQAGYLTPEIDFAVQIGCATKRSGIPVSQRQNAENREAAENPNSKEGEDHSRQALTALRANLITSLHADCLASTKCQYIQHKMKHGSDEDTNFSDAHYG